MAEKRPKNSELRLDRLEAEEPPPDEERGILELFDRPGEPRPEDEPIRRDPEQ